jgi:quercetin 2,3-dioxygenase
MPSSRGGKPSSGAKPFPKQNRSDRFFTPASGTEQDDGEALPIRACARVFEATLEAGETLEHCAAARRLV